MNKRSRNGRKGCREGGGTVCGFVWVIIMNLCVVEDGVRVRVRACMCVCASVCG